MTEQTALAPRQETGMSRVKNYMLSPEVKASFTDMLGSNAIYYINQVLIVVANSPKLQECEPKSILISAMRAASLRLSVDPGQGQAWIIPYNGRATFQLGYRGVYELAMRTNLYRFINVIDIYEGETVSEDRMTGMHAIEGRAISRKVIARMLYFELLNGFKKTFVMTVDEIDEHARQYSAGYSKKDSPWQSERERPKMERKTVLVNGLRKWGRFNQGDADLIDEIEDDQGFIDRMHEIPDEDQVSAPVEKPKQTSAQIMSDLGFGAAQEPKPEKPAPEKPSAESLTWDQAAVLKLSKDYGTIPNRIANALAYCKMPKTATYEQLATWMKAYRAARDADNDVIASAEIANKSFTA